MNMAALWELPVLFVCVNNQYGMGTRIDHATRSIPFDLRVKALCLAADIADGEDVEEGMTKAQALADGARQGKPGFLSVSCHRFYGHGRMDKSPYRSAAEEEAGRKRDPVAWARSELTRRGLACAAELDKMDAAIGREMGAAIEFTAGSPQPPLSSMFRDVLAPGEPEPEPVRTRFHRVLADAREAKMVEITGGAVAQRAAVTFRVAGLDLHSIVSRRDWGSGFTPIINAPEMAILGVARTRIWPMWNGQAFQPRLMLPLSLSDDHRAIDGAVAARFMRRLCGAIEDARRMALQRRA